MSECWIGIGANLGDPCAAFDAAWRELDNHHAIFPGCRSGLYCTAAVGSHAGNVFTNAVLSLTTSLSPLELLDQLQAIENHLGRNRDIRWGPRVLDLDLLYFDQVVLHEPRLVLPHPAAWYRRFVIDPMLEIAPNLVHPTLQETIAQLHSRLTERPLVLSCPADEAVEFSREEMQIYFSKVQIIPSEWNDVRTAIHLKLHHDSIGPQWKDMPVADLSGMPGDAHQRIVDFLTSVLDEPSRIGDW